AAPRSTWIPRRRRSPRSCRRTWPIRRPVRWRSTPVPAGHQRKCPGIHNPLARNLGRLCRSVSVAFTCQSGTRQDRLWRPAGQHRRGVNMVNEVDVTIRGHVGHDPTIFRGEGRRSYVRLNVASTPRIRTREGEWADGATQWFTVKLFGDLAENTAVSIRKGDAVLVRGRLEHEEYETREGERRWSAVVMAESFGPELRYASAH